MENLVDKDLDEFVEHMISRAEEDKDPDKEIELLKWYLKMALEE